MRLRHFALGAWMVASASATLIDRIAIIANSSIIKDSDIARDIRLTDFLNGNDLSLSPEARKKAADRLIEQEFIRHEIRIGDYPTASMQRAQGQIKSLEHNKYKSDAALQSALQSYGLTEADLEMHVQWQLSVLQFIDARFRPAAYTTDQEVDDYLKKHEGELKRQNPTLSTAALEAQAQTILVAEKVNQLFFSWLDEQKKSAKVTYLEDSLK